MKKIFFAIILVALTVTGCKKDYQGDSYNFDNSLPPYVTLSSLAAKTVAQGKSTSFTFQMRTALQQVVTVSYSISGAVTMANQTVVIDRDKTTGVATVTIPANVITAPSTTATATLTLDKAVAADGTNLTIGQNNVASAQKVTIKITQ